MFAWTIKDSYRFFDTKELHSRPDFLTALFDLVVFLHESRISK